MKQLILVTLILVVAGGALAEDTFGLWLQVDGESVNGIQQDHVTVPFTLSIGLHDPSVATVGGYELGIEMPDWFLILNAWGPPGWMNAGTATNQLVGYTTPLPAVGEPFTILGEILCLGLIIPAPGAVISFGAGEPSSIPEHDGPVIADGADPTVLIPGGYVGGRPAVFVIYQIGPVETQTWSGVKSLFD